MQAVESYLDELVWIAENPTNTTAATDAVTVVLDLKNVVFNEILEQDFAANPELLALCSAMLLNSDKSILNFLQRTATPKHKDLARAREHMFDFLGEYVKLLGQSVQEYALVIKETCLGAFRRELSNRAKVATFAPILNMIELRMQSLDAEKLGVREMAEIYLKDFTCGKSSQTVKSWTLQMLGSFAEYFPEHMFDKSKQLLTLFSDSLLKQFKSKKPDFQLIAGSVKGLTSLLVHFSGDFLADQKMVESIYKYVCLGCLNPPPGLKTYDIPKAALSLVAKHARLFKEYLTEQSEKIYKYITVFCTHKNRAVRKHAFPALDAFLTQVSHEIISDARSAESNRETFKFFMREFWTGLDSRTSGMYDISMCIRGFGLFAKATKRFLGVQEVKKMAQKMISFQHRYFSQASILQVEDTISHLPSFIASFANILLELNEVDDTYVDHLENVIGTFFLVYPQLYDVKRWSYYMAISRLFVALYSKGSALQNLLSRIVFQGLTLTCSKPIVKQSPENTSTTQSAEYYTEYQDLWKNLLNPRIPDELEFSEHQRKDLCTIIYNEFMQSIIRMVQKLVLQYNVVKENAQGEEKAEDKDKEAELLATSEINPNLLKPVVPKDFELFLNLVNFCKMILPQLHQELFEKWIYIFAKEIIIKSNQFPLVSGFYKLLGVTLKVSDQLKYFDQMDEAVPEFDAMTDIDDEPASKATNMDLQTKRVCYTLISKFIQEVETRMKQYKDELLASCLSLVLSVPKAFVTIADKVASLQLCLKLGESYWPLACVALDALEQWTKALAAQLKPHLARILPSFNSYLKATASSATYVQAQPGQSALQRIEGVSALTAEGEDDKKLKSEIQLRMLRLLAQLGGDNVNLIQDVDLATSSSETSIAWDTVKRVKFVVPFQDVKPDVWLDDLLPRIVELAEEASDRQTKVAACELLHSVVLYMIGSNAKLEPVPVHKIYARLFPAMIRLAVDVEQVTRQLFEPLMMQVIHWFTKNQTEENTETMTLLDSIIECVASPSDGAVREFSAKCLTEFLKWSIKQSSKKQQEKNPFNAKSLFKRVYSLMHHPNPYKRMGAYLTVKSLYRVFREEQALVDQFALELSHALLFSMRLAQHDDTSLGTARLALSVLEALTRIIERHLSMLSKPNSARRAHADLNAFLAWVLSQTARSERVVRRAAQGLIARLTAPSAAAWVQKHVLPRRPLSTLIALFEGGVEYEEQDEQDAPQRAAVSHKDALPSLPDLPGVMTWLSRVQASLDLWTWAFSTNVLAPGEVLAAKNGSRLMSWCAHFLTHYQLRTVVSDEHSTHYYLFRPLTPLEIDQFFTQQCSILHLYFKLLHVLLDKHQQASTEILLPSFTESFFKLFFSSILAPEQLGFVTNKISQQKKMMALTCNLCRLFTQVLPKSQCELMKKVLRHMLQQPEMNLLTLNFKHSNLDVERARCLVQGYAQLHACELLMDSLPKHTNLTEHLLVQAFDHSDNYTPLEMSVGGLTLQLTFSLHPSEKHLHALIAALIKLLLDETLVEDRSQPTLEELQSSVRASQRNENDDVDNVPTIESSTVSVKKSTKGEVFYKNFREQIDDFIANNVQYFVKPIMTHIHKNYLMFRVLLNVVDRQVRHRSANSKAVVQLVVAHLSQLNVWIKLESTQEQKESVLELLKRVMQVSVSAECVTFAREVLCTFMSRAMPLLFKTDVLDLLPALLVTPHSTEQHKKQMRERIRELVTYDFPVQSTDLPQDSAVYNEYISCLNKLMQVLVQTGDLMLLEELYPIFRERRHRHTAHLEQQLGQFVKTLKHHAEHAVHCFNMIMTVVADPTMTAWLKYNLTRHILLPLYELLPLNHQIQVMQQQIHLLVKTINIEELDSKASLSGKQSQSSTDDTLTAADVVDRICAFTLIQVMYQCLPSNAIREKINKAYYTKSDAKGNELTTTIMRASHYIKSQQLSVTSSSVFNEGVTRDLLLEYQGTAFNTLAAVVMCTQSKENFFTVFCFKENATKHEYLWENIIDTDKLCQFEVETNFPVAHKEVTSLLSKYRATMEGAQDKQTNLRYISSQYLADSSLSEDISNTSFFGKEHEDAENRAETELDKPREESANTNTGAEETGELIELDPINSNPCMLALLRLIDHLQKQFGTTYSKEEMPKWMKELHIKCAAPETHVNIRLFIVKLIINRAEVFAPYARQWLTPVMKTLLDHWLAVLSAAKSQGPQADPMDIDQAANSEAEADKDDEAASSTPDTNNNNAAEQSYGQVLNGFHYFTRDVCIVLLKWSDIGDLTNHKPSEEDKHVITQFIEFLMRHCAYHVRGIVYANLQLIRLLIERWKDVLHKTLSKKIVMDYLGYDRKPKAMKMCRLTGLHLLSALVYNGFAYYDKASDHISEAVFLDRLLNNLSGPREVYKSASETIGLALAWDIKHNTRQSALEDQVKDRITVMFSKEDHIRALTSLEAIGKYYPAFIDHFFVRIFGQLKRFISEAKVIALRLILHRLDDIEDPFAKIQPRLSELIRHRDEDAQLVTLQIIFQLLPRIEEVHISKFIGDLMETFATHPNDKCRDLYYDILLWIYGNREALRGTEELKRSLLQGMSDEEEDIKRKVFNFWDAKILSEQPLDRVQELMGDLFHPKLEHHWLQYTTYLLLNLTNRSVDYDRVMFEALTNCEYREYRIDSSWQFKTAPMTPLFASQSLSQMDMSPSLDAGLSSQSPDASDAFMGIRATQATQGATSSMFGFGTALATEFETMSTQDPNMFITLPISTKFKGPTSTNNNNTNVVDTQPGSPDFKRPMARKRAAESDAPGAQPTKRRQVTFDVPASQGSQGSQSQDLFATPSQSLSAMEQERQIRLQRRFAKTPLSMTQQGGALYAARALRQKKMREAVKRESSRARARHVTLCRAYRAGDLPDVGIAPRDLLRPLATLATRDAPLARLAWSHMMISLVRTLDNKKNTVAAALAPLVRTLLTKVSAAPLVAALLRLASSIALRLPAKSVSAASLRSLTAQAGAVVIETQLLDMLGISSPAPSKDVEETRESWLALSKVYKALREEDILLGLYEKNICKLSLTKEALEAELQGDYTQACKKYTEAINHLDQHGRDKTQWANNPPTDQEVDLWENGLLECYVKLTDWELLNKNTHAEIEGRTEMLWQDNYREPYLGYYVRSSMKIKDKWPELWQFIDKSDEQQKVILEQQFSAELAFIYITRDDLARARYYVNRFYQQFLAQWAALPELQTAGRRILLQSVQRVYELEEYLNFVDKEYNLLSRYRAQGLIKRWRDRYPSPHLDDVNVWENIVEQRATLLGKLSERFSAFWSNKLDDTELPDALVSARRRSNQGLGSPLKKINLSEVKHMLIDERVDIYRAMATGARKQGNFSVADKYLRLSLKAKDKDKKKDFDFPFFTSLVKLHCLKAQNSRHNVDAVDKFAKALKYLEGKKHEEVIVNQPDNRRKFLMMEGDIYHHLYQLARDYPAAVVDSANKNHLDELMDKCAVKTVEDQLLQLTLHTYDTAASIVQGVDRSRDASLDQSRDESAFAASVKSSAKSLLKFGLFCDEAIKSIEDGKKSAQSLEVLKEKMIVVILEAMRLGSPAARDRFPRLLQLLYGEAEAKNSVLGESFANTCKTIPCWMFIRWTSQMMAVLSKAEAAFVLPILIEIGEQYPQALYYQFKISTENIVAYQYREGSATMNQQRKLKRAMQHDLLDVFVSQLEKMTHPEHRFKDWTDALKPLMHADVTQRDAAAIKQLWSEIWTDCFDSKQPHLGSYNKQFATTYAKLVEGVFGADGSKLVSLDVTKMNKTIQELSEKMRKNMGSNQTVKQRLTEFSLWLARFDQSEHTQYIELPGQYQGDVKPQPHHHVHIASFDESLLVMGSMRKPKRLKMRGNDERDYPFLVKGGEDLRLDQRIQQLFSVMNQILRQDPHTSSRRLHLHTYQVIPMTNRVGIIEWLENTKPVKAIVEEELQQQEASEQSILKIKAAQMHDNWIKNYAKFINTKTPSVSDMYYAMFKHATRKDTTIKMNAQHDTVAWNLLRSGIEALSTSPEAYLILRDTFARSLAVFSICSYIIGIGDRHLDNFLINLKSGAIVGIDFGHAFGTATQFLPIPELIPFRLTRQFTNFLLPLDREGLLKHTMVHTLQALQNGKDILLNTMDVFVQEPLLDWQKLARRLAAAQGAEKDEQQIWFPKKKIEIAKQKLELFNPAYITLGELTGSIHHNKNYMAALKDIVLGDPKVNPRALVKEKCQSTTQQVECLIDQATDPNILGRSWGGWASWI